MANPSNQPVERDDSFKLLDFSLPPSNLSVHPVDAILMPKARATNWQRWYQMVYYQSRKASRSRSETAWGGWSDQIRNKRIFQSVNCLTTTWHDTAHFLVIFFISLKAVWCSLRLVSPRDRAQRRDDTGFWTLKCGSMIVTVNYNYCCCIS